MRFRKPSLLQLTLLSLVTLPSCFSWNYARDQGLRPPDRPKPGTAPRDDLPDWMKSPPKSDADEFPAADLHRETTRDSVTIDIRLDAPRIGMLADRAAIRIDLPVGFSKQPTGLAELSAMAVADLPGASDRPSLRALIGQLGGNLDVEIGPEFTRFLADVPTADWDTVVREISERLHGTPVTRVQLEELQDRLIRSLLTQWKARPALGYAAQWSRFGDRTRRQILSGIQDRHLTELRIFRRRYYQPTNAKVGVWLPEITDVQGTVAATKFGLASWSPRPKPSQAAKATDPIPVPSGGRWIEGPGLCRIAILLPIPADTPEWRIMLESLTMGGLGGRLGTALENALQREPVLQAQEIGSDDRHFLVLHGSVAAKSVPAIWREVQQTWSGLGTSTPTGAEFVTAKARVRLRLARRQDQPGAWLRASSEASKGGPVRDLHALADLENVRGIARAWSERSPAMVVHGGVAPKLLPKGFTKIVLKTPDYEKRAVAAPSTKKDAKSMLELAVKAIGDRKRFELFAGYDLAETWKDDAGIEVHVTTTHRNGETSRTLDALGTRIVQAAKLVKNASPTGTERVGTESKKLSPGEATDLLEESLRHPIALLAAWVKGEMDFRMVGTRKQDGRDLVVLERVDPSKSRLRIAIEPRSGLVRSVDSIRHLANLGAVVVRDAYDDYRQQASLRVPMHRVTTLGDEREGVDAVVVAFKYVIR